VAGEVKGSGPPAWSDATREIRANAVRNALKNGGGYRPRWLCECPTF